MFIGRRSEQIWLKDAASLHPIVFIHGLKGVGKKALVQQVLKENAKFIYLRAPLSPELIARAKAEEKTPVFVDFHRLPSLERLQFIDELRALDLRCVVLSDFSVDLEIDFSIPRLHLKPFSQEEFSELVKRHRTGTALSEVETVFAQCMGVPLLVHLWFLGNLDPQAVEVSYFGKLSEGEQVFLKAVSCFEDGIEADAAASICGALNLDAEKALRSLRAQYLFTDSRRVAVNSPFLPYVAKLPQNFTSEFAKKLKEFAANEVEDLFISLNSSCELNEEDRNKILKLGKHHLQKLNPSYLKAFLTKLLAFNQLNEDEEYHLHSIEVASLVLFGDRSAAARRALQLYEKNVSDDSQCGTYKSRFIVDLVNLLNRSSQEEVALPIAQRHLHSVATPLKSELSLEFVVSHKDLASKTTYERLHSLLKSLDEKSKNSALGCHIRFQMSRNRGLNRLYKESAALLAENYQVFLRHDQTYDAGFAGFNVALMLFSLGEDKESTEWVNRVELRVRTVRFPYLHFGLSLLKAGLHRRKGEFLQASDLLGSLRPAFESASLPLRAKKDYAKEFALNLHLLGRHEAATSLLRGLDLNRTEKLEILHFEDLSEVADVDLTKEGDLSVELAGHALLFGLLSQVPERVSRHQYVVWFTQLRSVLDGKARKETSASFDSSPFEQVSKLIEKKDFDVSLVDGSDLSVQSLLSILSEGRPFIDNPPHTFWTLWVAKLAKQRPGIWLKTQDNYFEATENWASYLSKADLAIVDFESRVFVKGKESAPLRTKRVLFKALRLMIETYPSPVTKLALVQGVWGEVYDPLVHDSRIYATIQRLRESLRKKWIVTSEEGYSISREVSFCFVVNNENEKTDLRWLEQRILRAFRDLNTDSVRRVDLAELLSVSDATLKRALLELTQSGRIEKVGSGPNTQYRLAS